jgi:hypothetical protein
LDVMEMNPRSELVQIGKWSDQVLRALIIGYSELVQTGSGQIDTQTSRIQSAFIDREVVRSVLRPVLVGYT